MLNEVLENIWRMEIPLPGNPLKSINSYVIKGDERHLIIDTGLDMVACEEAFVAGLAELSVDLHHADIFLTHMHADHISLLSMLSPLGDSRVMIGALDEAFLRSWTGWESVFGTAEAHGFPVDELREQSATSPFLKFQTGDLPAMVPLEGTEVLKVGGYELQCVPTPGHTEGHICLFEPMTKTLFSGDHILGRITPNIQGWASHRNPLVEYLDSLDVSAARDVDLVLPGHRQPFSNHEERIEQLKAHHGHRLDEALAALDGAGKTAYDVAPLLRWDYDVKDWGRWPLAQRWFATGEALAHLRWLVHSGVVSEERENGRVLYCKG